MGKEHTQNLNLTHKIKLNSEFSKNAKTMKYLTSSFIFYEGVVGLVKILSHPVYKS